MGCMFSAEEKKLFRVLVLGTAGCGKSTFARQMKILFCNGFNEDELFNYKTILVQNLMLGIRDLINLAEEANLPDIEQNKKLVKYFKKINPYTTQLDDSVIEKVNKLWKETEIINSGSKHEKKSEYSESLKYVLNNLEKISGDGWTPSNEDILHVRQRTTGIVETSFQAHDYLWTLIDVGGQKVERRKWIHSQQNLNAMIYFLALDEYDVQNEEAGTLGIEESFEVWNDTINSPMMTQSSIPIILFLNKKDLFEKKLKDIPLKNTYKKYKGGKDYEKGVQFIKEKFLAAVPEDRRDSIYVYPTCAIDTDQTRIVFDSVKHFILRERLRNSGL